MKVIPWIISQIKIIESSPMQEILRFKLKTLALCFLTLTSVFPMSGITNSDLADRHVRPMASAGRFHSHLLDQDGVLWSWGENSLGQLATGDNTRQYAPVKSLGAGEWIKVSAGGFHSVGLKQDGTIWVWGNNTFGQLAKESIIITTTPLQVGNGSDWVDVEAGRNFNIALKNDGTIWGWGLNSDAQLGEVISSGNILDNVILTPRQLMPDTDWVDIEVGEFHAGAYKPDGTFWTWGKDDEGQLGRNGASFPAAPIESDTKFVKFALGYRHSLAISEDGYLWGWGFNSDGQVGDGTLLDQRRPRLIDGSAKWRSVSAGTLHSTGIQENGTIWLWGDNDFGQLGFLDVQDRSRPTWLEPSADWVLISAGRFHTIGVRADGTLQAWGDNGFGQVGDGVSDKGRFEPVPVATDLEWRSISAGRFHSLGVTQEGSLYVWGSNEQGQLGIDQGQTRRPELTPVLLGEPGDWIDAKAGRAHSIAWKKDGTLWAWGDNDFYQLGDGTTEDRLKPVQITDPGDWVQISTGNLNNMAIKADGSLWGWGNNKNYELGNGSSIAVTEPRRIGFESDWAYVDVGTSHTMALKQNGQLYIWGTNRYGQLGRGDKNQRIVPSRVSQDRWISIATGLYHSMAVKEDGTLWSWGLQLEGRLGYDSALDVLSPRQVGEDTDWSKIFAGFYHSMGIKEDGSLWGWGATTNGRLGIESGEPQWTPVQVDAEKQWEILGLGENHSLGIQVDGSLYGWGLDDSGQLGTPTLSSIRESPTTVESLVVQNPPVWVKEPTVFRSEQTAADLYQVVVTGDPGQQGFLVVSKDLALWDVVQAFTIPDSRFITIEHKTVRAEPNLFFEVRRVADPANTPVNIFASRQLAGGDYELIVHGPPNRYAMIEIALDEPTETYSPVTQVRLSGDGSLIYRLPKTLLSEYSPLGFRARLTPELLPRDPFGSGPVIYDYRIKLSDGEMIDTQIFITGKSRESIVLLGTDDLGSSKWKPFLFTTLNADGAFFYSENSPVQESPAEFYWPVSADFLSGWNEKADVTLKEAVLDTDNVNNSKAILEISSSGSGWAMLEGRSRSSQAWTPLWVIRLKPGISSTEVSGRVFRNYRFR